MLRRHKHRAAASAELPLDQWEKLTGNILDLQLMPKLTGPGQEHWPSPKRYVVQLHPAGGEAFQAEVLIHPVDFPEDFYFSQPGAVTGFVRNPATGEVRFDMTDTRNSTRAHQAGADHLMDELLSGVPADPGEPVTGPPWVVPETCPDCGARVDQATSAMELDPRCAFCHQPLPAQPRARF